MSRKDTILILLDQLEEMEVAMRLNATNEEAAIYDRVKKLIARYRKEYPRVETH